MSHTITEEVLNIKRIVQEYITPLDTYISNNIYSKTEADTTFARKYHASPTTDYGTATDDNYGHVKIVDDLTIEGNTDAATTKNAVLTCLHTYVTNKLEALRIEYGDETSGKIFDALSKYNIESKLKRFTIAIPYQKPNDYQIDGYKAFEEKYQDSKGLDNYTFAGHYHINSQSDDLKIEYGNGIYKHYANALLDIRRIGVPSGTEDPLKNIIIQEIYTTIKNADNKYELSGEKYTRKGVLITPKTENPTSTITWENWQAAQIPYSESDIKVHIDGTGINQIVLKENTAGYIIEWNQEGAYALETSANGQKVIAHFSNELNVSDIPCKFSNHLGGFEIKIDKTNIYLTSNKQQGANIEDKYLKQTYFIPRAG